LVVIAIIAILAAILFPVFAQAKQAAKKAVAISNMKQGVLAELMYQNDYDDALVMSDTGCISTQANCVGWGYGPPDSVPFENMYPYTKNMQITVDPMDPVQSVTQREQDEFTSIDNAGVPIYPPNIAQGTTAELEYAAAARSNMGYNFAFLSPWIIPPSGKGIYIGSASINSSQVTQPAHTLMFGTSIWNRQGGTPTGGGNWVVQTPCWEDANGNYLEPIATYAAAGTLFSYGSGWDPSPTSPAVYGFLWPFYNITSSTAATGAQNGQVVIGWCDGHAKSMPISQVAAGCSAYGTSDVSTAPVGRVTDPSKFIWAINQ
jgi:type II secretory pathway pseudopilin PulG